MIPYKDFILNPEKYKPLGSVKSILNKQSENTFDTVDIKKLFNSSSNISKMTLKLYEVYLQNGGKDIYDKFSNNIIYLSKTFSNENNLYNFKYVDSTNQNNWVEILKFINNKFTKYCYNWFKWNSFVPTRDVVEVGTYDNRKKKHFFELMADDIPTLNYWRKQEVYRVNNMFRYNNEIPFWQKTMNTRYYDKSNEGFRNGDSDRASLENPVYDRYNMSNMNDLLDSWNKGDWFGIG